MSVGMFMNMEPLYLKIARDHIAKMTDENHFVILCSNKKKSKKKGKKAKKKSEKKENETVKEEWKCLDDKKMLNNLENGLVAITQLDCFIESFLNTILNSILKREDNKVFRKTSYDKLKLIFESFEKDYKEVIESELWNEFRNAAGIRNELVHYKRTYVAETIVVQDLTIDGKDISDFFAKSNMKELLKKHIALTEFIAAKLELQLNKDVKCFDSDGKDGPIQYVFDPKNVAYVDYAQKLQ